MRPSVFATSLLALSSVSSFHAPSAARSLASAAGQAQMSSARVSLGAGCYWGTEKFIKKDFQSLFPSTIKQGAVGFMNPSPNAPANPSYRDVCSGRTGFVEVYDVEYVGGDSTFEALLRYFYSFHDPTTTDRQGNDRVTQYASAVFCYTPEQQQIAEKVKLEIQALVDAGKIRAYEGKKITTAILPATKFYAAQADHQAYLEKNPWGYCNHANRWRMADFFPTSSR